MRNLYISVVLLSFVYFQNIAGACQQSPGVAGIINTLPMTGTIIRTWMSSDGRFAAAANESGQLRIKNLMRNEITTFCDLLVRHNAPREICIDPSFKLCACANDIGLFVYDLQKREKIHSWLENLHYPKFNMTGSRLACFDTKKNSYIIRDMPSGHILINTHDPHPDGAHVYFNTENTHCALKKGDGIEFYDVRTGDWRKQLWSKPPSAAISSLTSFTCTAARPYFLLDQQVAAIPENGPVEVFDVNMWSLRKFNNIQVPRLSKILYWRARNLLVVASRSCDKKYIGLQYTSNECVPVTQEVPSPGCELTLAKIDPTGRFFVVSMIGADGKPHITIHDGQTKTLSELPCGARKISFASTGHRAITNNGDIIALY